MRAALCAAAVLATTVVACYQTDPQAESDALAAFGREQAATHRRAHPRSPGPAVLAKIDLDARRAAIDGAWLVPMPSGFAPVALDIHGDRATLVAEDGDHDARVTWPLPCEVDLTVAEGGVDSVWTFDVAPDPTTGVRLVHGVVAEQVGDTLIACADRSLFVLDAAGSCTRWTRLRATDRWIHAPDDCSTFASLPADGPRRWAAVVRELMSIREPDLAAARAAR